MPPKKNAPIADTGVKRKSRALDGKRVALAVCGGIGATESVKNARELRRHGAHVTAYFTPSVPDFITELSVGWATGEPVVTKLGQDADHLEPFDLVIVAPATLNTIAKCALGLADNAVTLIVASQLGRKAPVLFVPAMNLQLARHPMYGEHVKRLEAFGATFFEQSPEEDRLKMPAPEALAARAAEVLA